MSTPIDPKPKRDKNLTVESGCYELEERVAALEADLTSLTKDYQQEFDKINELMGAMVDKLAEHDTKLAEHEARIKSLEHPK